MPEKIKVAYLDYSHVFAGAERVLHTIISCIDRTKYEPILIFPYPMSHHVRYQDLDCKKIYLSDRLKWWMGSDRWKHPMRGTDFLARTIFGTKLSVVIKRENVNILHVNLLRPDSLMWLLPSRRKGLKIIGHFRSQAREWIPSKYVQACCDIILCVSDYSKSRLLSKGKHTKTITLYDSIDVDSLQSTLNRNEAKQKLGFPENSILFSSVGQLSKHKGHDNAIHAFARIASKFPNALLFIAGGGCREDLEDLKRIVLLYPDIKDRVRFSEKQLSNIADVYRASDITLSLTKVGEAFGLVPYESVWMGTPFIGPDKGAIKEFVKDKENGLIVDTECIDDIASNMEWALENPLLMEEMSKELLASIKTMLIPTIMTRKIESIYADLYKD